MVPEFLSRRRLAALSVGGVASGLGTALTTSAASSPLTSGATNMLVDVRQHGARGDGTTDDAPAINAAIDEVRWHHAKADRYNLACRLVFPAGVYVIGSSLNFTMLRGIDTVIDGQASVLLGRCRDAPVIDALGARWLMMRDLTIVGDPEFMPTTGLQIGRMSHAVADDHRIANVKIVGSYARGCLYNLAAETSVFEHVLLWNDWHRGYSLIQDGLNYFGATSSFTSVDLPTHSDLSFNENVFISCDFRSSAGGTTVWLGDTTRHAFIRCYAATDIGPAFVVYCGARSHTMLDVDCHCEADGLRNVFFFDGIADHLRVHGFSYIEHTCFANHAIFSAARKATKIELENARLEVALYRDHKMRIFDQPDRWRVSGSYYSSSRDCWNGDDNFVGLITIGTGARFVGMSSHG